MNNKLLARLQERQASTLRRERITVDDHCGSVITVAGRRYINFSSNDYLGLSQHPRLIDAARDACLQHGVGATASHLVCGHQAEHEALEQALAAFTGRERALVFSSGFMANQALMTTLLDKNDAVFHDRLNHASLLDGAALSGARSQRFLHNDLQNLEKRLQRSPAETRLIAVDGVFSMDGDCADLIGLAALAKRYDALLMVDDAHGLGVFGNTGAGLCEHLRCGAVEVPILMGTFGKALGGSGAFVAGSNALIELLIQFARSYIYTTALPPGQAAAMRAALRVVREEPILRETLHARIAQFRAGAQRLRLPLMCSSSAIQPLLVGDEARAMRTSALLREQGIWVSAIRTPTVAAGQARLRVTLSATHSEQQVSALLAALESAL